jgi:hypothetical protein
VDNLVHITSDTSGVVEGSISLFSGLMITTARRVKGKSCPSEVPALIIPKAVLILRSASAMIGNLISTLFSQ